MILRSFSTPREKNNPLKDAHNNKSTLGRGKDLKVKVNVYGDLINFGVSNLFMKKIEAIN